MCLALCPISTGSLGGRYHYNYPFCRWRDWNSKTKLQSPNMNFSGPSPRLIAFSDTAWGAGASRYCLYLEQVWWWGSHCTRVWTPCPSGFLKMGGMCYCLLCWLISFSLEAVGIIPLFTFLDCFLLVRAPSYRYWVPGIYCISTEKLLVGWYKVILCAPQKEKALLNIIIRCRKF